MSSIHLCLSGSLACSGMNPCEACLLEVRHRVLSRAAYEAGFNGSPEQWHALIGGYMAGWQLFQQAMLSDPALRARVQMRDVTQAQATSPVARLGDGDGDAPVPAPPPASPFGAPPNYSPGPTQGFGGYPEATGAPAWPWAAQPGQPGGVQEQPIGTAPMPPPPAQPIPNAPPVDPLGVMNLAELQRVQAASKGGSVVTRRVPRPAEPPPMSAEDVARAGGPLPKGP